MFEGIIRSGGRDSEREDCRGGLGEDSGGGW